MLAEEIIKEINLIPTTKLHEIYDFIHYFRIASVGCVPRTLSGLYELMVRSKHPTLAFCNPPFSIIILLSNINKKSIMEAKILSTLPLTSIFLVPNL
jgi:hypothetical protein